MKKYIAMTALIPAVAVLAFATGTRADDVFCPPFIQFETVDNVIVDDLCIIRGSTIEGNIKVGPGGSVAVIGTPENPSTIEGNFESDGGLLVQAVGQVLIKGDVIIKNTGPGPSGLGGIVGHRRVIEGNVVFENNSGIVIAAHAAIGGNLELFDNTAGANVVDNVIGGDLDCDGNVEADVRFAGSGNIAGGDKVGQCAGF